MGHGDFKLFAAIGAWLGIQMLPIVLALACISCLLFLVYRKYFHGRAMRVPVCFGPFQIIPKLPYNFSYRFKDANGRTSKLQILDWEIGALFWNCRKACNGDEALALEKVRAKYLDEFLTKDLHFFTGTTQQFHFVAPNPWVVVGVFPIPHNMQDDLFSGN